MAASKKPEEKKSVISQLQSVGEDALGKLTKNPATRSALQGANQLKDRGGKVLAGFESLDKRLASIEKRLSTLESQTKKAPASRSRTATRKTTAKPRTTAPKANAES